MERGGARVILEKILATKRAEVAAMGESTVPTTPTRDVLKALIRARGDQVKLIAEFKRKSPSGGVLDANGDAAARARSYVAGGASMISVLTDREYFGGSFEDIESVRRAVSVPILAKEFVIDERQLAHARIAGADAVLLIVRIVPRARLVELAAEARRMGLQPFVEVVNEEELETALAAEAKIIGVNARDLDTLQMDVGKTAKILASIPSDVIGVHLSGLKSPEDVANVARTNADAALIGEALMRSADPEQLIRSMLAV